MGKYTIQAGDTLSGILEKYGDGKTSLNALVAHNNIKDPNRIFAGQVIELPGYNGDSTTGTVGKGSSGSGNSGYQYKTTAPTYTPYTESDSVTKAKNNATNAATAVTNYGDFHYGRQDALDDAINNILNREKFSYDINSDALYQQYKDKYIQQGKMAMQDTMGQAAAMTGGYGNSYAATAGNQAYQAYLNNLNDVVPELQQMAYDRYIQEGQDLYNQYGLLSDDRSTQYGEWLDGYNRALADRDYHRDVYDSERTYDYGIWSDNRTFDYNQYRAAISDEQWAAAMDYQNERDKADDDYRDKVFDAQYGNTGGISGSSGTGSGSGSGGNSGGSSYNNGGYGSDVVRQAQKFVGASADGMWGADSAAKAKAAGYNSIADVVKAMGNKTSAFTGGDWTAATAYLMEREISPTLLSNMAMDRTTWQRHKNSYNSTGQGGAEVANYGTYNEYLAAIVNYIAENYK